MFLPDLSISNAICFVQQKIFITLLSAVHPSKAAIPHYMPYHAVRAVVAVFHALDSPRRGDALRPAVFIVAVCIDMTLIAFWLTNINTF